MPDSPKVSVLLPVYNGEQYLDQAIETILDQDFTDFELIAVNDGSKDRTAEILAEWARRDPRVVVLNNEKNIGLPATLNVGLKAAHGEYIARQDCDDIALPGRLRTEVEMLDANPNAVLVSMNYHVIDNEDRLIYTTEADRPPLLLHWRLRFHNAVGGHAVVMFRKQVALELGGYDTDVPLAEDFDLWTRMLKRGDILIAPQPGMRYRAHDNRATMVQTDKQRLSTWRIVRRVLGAQLGRAVDEEEAKAITHLWSLDVRPGSKYAAHAIRLTREAYQAWAPSLTPAERRMVRVETARQCIAAASAMGRRRWVADSIRHILYGLSWHPFGAMSELVTSVVRQFKRGRGRTNLVAGPAS